MELTVGAEEWPRIAPFRINGYVFTSTKIVDVTLRDSSEVGRGETSGIYYRGETSDSIVEQIEAVRDAIESNVDHETLRLLLPPGGARNALDSALWDLESKRKGVPVWSLAGVARPHPLPTMITIGADGPKEMAERARSFVGAKAIKLKLTSEDPAGCVRAVRAALPDVWLGVDANRGFSRKLLETLIPTFEEVRIGLIEQPLPLGHDAELDGLRCEIPIAADESVQGLTDLPIAAQYYDVVNIKLDKCGGLTEGLLMAREARKVGLKVMVGCTSATSLGIAPAFVLGQLCDFVDLDAPMFLSRDRSEPVRYANGEVFCPDALWGSGSPSKGGT
jgi:L-alanine-DL-glutamate epimerase-like enolase superfamily enzyme